MSQEALSRCKAGEECRNSFHLCRLMSRTRDHERVKPFVRDPAYYCRNCGRAARAAESLCRPMPL